MPKVDWITRIVLLMCLAANIIGEQSLNACCSKTGYPACRSACMRLVSPSPSYTYKYFYRFSHVTKRLAEFVSNCPRSEVDFWNCLHQWRGLTDFTSDSKKNLKSEHLDCCSYANHVSCQLHCLTAKNTSYLENENCGKSREESLNKCLTKVYAHRSCCDSSEGPQCQKACIKYFKDSSSSPFDQNFMLEKACGRSSNVFKCAVNESGFESAVVAFTKCCRKSYNDSCKKACEQQFRQFSREDKFSQLRQYCGAFDTTDPMYSCILRTADSSKGSRRPSKAGYQTRTTIRSKDPVETPVVPNPDSRMTNMKDQCCSRAKSRECRVWCSATISIPTMMGLWDTMYLQCIQDPKEVELSSCMNDMLEPCQLSGYYELKFCTAFNNRPLDSFRRFSAYGDSSAKKIYDIWAEGTVTIFGYELVFKDINTCLPESWKAIACLLAVSPCNHKRKQTQVCRQDCVDLLDTCLDYSKMGSTVSTLRVCSLLLRNDNQSGCVSVKDYLNPVIGGSSNHQVALPCSPNPCKTGEVCSINRSCTSESMAPCKMYTCLKGCPVSGDSNLLVPIGSLAKLVQETKDGRSYRVCECVIVVSSSFPMTYFDKCKYFGSEKEDKCTFYSRSWDNGAIFYDGCNMCTCSSGTIICTKRQCVKTITNSNARPRRHHASDVTKKEFPCNCPDVYNPMCASNGVTYPNLCLASCAKFQDYQLDVGDCQSVDPCDPNPCMDRGLTCVPKRSSCLSLSTHCPQYKCWFGISRYLSEDDECQTTNQIPSQVCGYDAATYSSMCRAHLAGAGVDYNGTCSTDDENADGLTNRCLAAPCSTVGEARCTEITPPGACCPICGSILRILYSQQDLQRHQDFISYRPVTVKDVVEKIRMQIVVAGCEASGYLSVEGDLVIIIKVGNSYQMSKEHFHACVTEAERLHAYINDQSPQVTTKYYLSILKASDLQSSRWTNVKSAASRIISSIYLYSLIVMLLVCDVVR